MTTTLGESVEGRLMTSEQKESFIGGSVTASVETEFKSKSQFHEASVKVGLSTTASHSVTKAVASEMEKTMVETNSWSQTIECPETGKGEVRFALTQQIMKIRETPRSITVGGKTLYFQERRDYETVVFSDAYKIKSPELRAKWLEIKATYPTVRLSAVEYNTFIGGAIDAPKPVSEGFADGLQGSRWSYVFNESTFEFQFGNANAISNFSNGWWPGVTWEVQGKNKVILKNTPKEEDRALPPGPAADGKQMVLIFDSADSYRGVDFDGATLISGRRLK